MAINQKLLRTLFLIQLPIVICVLIGTAVGSAHGDVQNFKDNTSAQDQYYLATANQVACIVLNEGLNSGAASSVTKIRDHFSFGWWSRVEPVAHFLTAKTVRYIETIISVHRFRSTDIIYPFHSFL